VRRRSRFGRGRPEAIGLSDAFRAWVVDNALRGVPPASLASTLVEGGVPGRIAVAEVAEIVGSPAFEACRDIADRLRSLELVARLAREVARAAPAPEQVERRETLTADELYERHFAASRPVVLTRFLEGWSALSRWSPEYFKERFGHVEIEVMSGRDGDPEPDRNFEAHREKVRMADYVDRVRGGGSTNDVYLVAHNNVLQHTELSALLEDVAPDESIFDPDLARCCSLWFGPAGTMTPLHHDTTNILFCQVYGRKRVRLVAPAETALVRGARGFYAGVDCEDPRFEEDPELAQVLVKDVELAAGEALFIPAGWWHRVAALEVSINLSLLGFRRHNDFDWYRPGR
jgi:hypothetical protein